MYKYISLGLCAFCVFIVTACRQSQPEPVEIPLVVSQPTEVVEPVKPQTKHSLGIIGEVEPVYLPPLKKPILARIDTGAANSSLDAKNIVRFEREGEKWVAFDFVNRSGEKHHFEKRLYKMTTITRATIDEKRPVVMMTVKMGKETISALFSLVNREDFDYQVLIGRNILTGRAIVDTALSKTLY